MNIGNSLKEIRKGRQLTQKELADKVGLSHSYISEIENSARRPSFDVIKQIADGLEIPFYYLLIKSLEKEDLNDVSKKEFLNQVNEILDESII